MTTEPKPVKPLVAFAAVYCDRIWADLICEDAGDIQKKVGSEYPGGWMRAKRAGYRIVKVRIEPVEE